MAVERDSPSDTEIKTSAEKKPDPDAAKLMRMALAASTGNDSEASIAYLKRAIALDERMAEPHYLLGAEYAGMGLYDQAVSEMQAALARKPELAAARFQVGLLSPTLAPSEAGAPTWGWH